MELALTILSIALEFGTFIEPTLSQQQAQIEKVEFQSARSGLFTAFLNRSLDAYFVLANISVQGSIECALACLRNEACLSINFATVPDTISNQYTCQLLPTDKYRDPDRFVLSDQFHHYAIPTPCESVPCKHSGGTCRPLYKQNDYECVGPVLTETLCEHSSEEIRCEKGGKINVLSASYGRLDISTCPHGQPLGNQADCRAANSLDKVRETCQGQTSCTLIASNSFFAGDPCYGIRKYLLVEYHCAYN